MKICSVEGCGKKHWAKGFCCRHFAQMVKFGKILTRTRHDPNNFIIEGDVGKIECFDNYHNSVGFALVDSEDLERCKPFKWHFERNYVLCTATKWYLHHLIMNHKPSRQFVIDHINGNGHDNRKQNLRICTHAQNTCNSKPGKNNTSGFVGVAYHPATNNWYAQISYQNRFYHIGVYPTKEQAAKAYNDKARELHGEFAFQNKIPVRINRRAR